MVDGVDDIGKLPDELTLCSWLPTFDLLFDNHRNNDKDDDLQCQF